MRCMKKIDENTVEELSIIKLISSEAFVEQEHPRDGDGKFAKKGSSKLPKETVDKIIDKIKNTWDDVSPTVHGSHFLTPNGEIIGNYNHKEMVKDLAPMINDFEVTGKVTRGGGRLKNMETGEWYDDEKTKIQSHKTYKRFEKENNDFDVGLDGLLTGWYENGQKKEEITYKDGKQDGLWTGWYANGQKKYEGTRKDGKLDGLYTDWDDNGQKKKERTFKNGKMISSKEWNKDGSVKND